MWPVAVHVGRAVVSSPPPPTMSDDKFKVPEYLKVPEALKTHPELVRRNVVLDYSLNIVSVPQTVVPVRLRANMASAPREACTPLTR